MALEMTLVEFEQLVEDALHTIPDELIALIDNCLMIIEPDAPEDDPELMGLYDGIPLTDRDTSYSMVLPDRIFIFQNPTLRMCDTRDDVVDEVHITVVHEIAHHFGISDQRLHELGYD